VSAEPEEPTPCDTYDWDDSAAVGPDEESISPNCGYGSETQTPRVASRQGVREQNLDAEYPTALRLPQPASDEWPPLADRQEPDSPQHSAPDEQPATDDPVVSPQSACSGPDAPSHRSKDPGVNMKDVPGSNCVPVEKQRLCRKN
jgi:hypothetical protein